MTSTDLYLMYLNYKNWCVRYETPAIGFGEFITAWQNPKMHSIIVRLVT